MRIGVGGARKSHPRLFREASNAKLELAAAELTLRHPLAF
jgi:hypothetical protein